MEAIALRQMRQEDVPAADALRHLIGWNQTIADWRRILSLEPAGCFTALKADAIVGTVTTVCYGRSLAWIGMMLVHPEHRRHGIASSLMTRAIDYLRAKGIHSIKLDATPAGKPLYERLGFISEWTLMRWQLPSNQAVAAAPNELSIRRIQLQDWPEVEAVDREAFGVGRVDLLRRLAGAETADTVVCLSEGSVIGWGMLRAGANAHYLGPVACWQPEGAAELINTLLPLANGRSIYWDIPDQNEPGKAIARKFGFAPVRPLTRMYLGAQSVISDLRLLFGIADPALG